MVMDVELLGALDYAKLEEELKARGIDDFEGIVAYIKQLEKEGRVHKVASAGMLSRSEHDVNGMLEERRKKSFASNTKVAVNITSMGHDSITDHDYLVFALRDVPITIEQTIIAERFSSFTIKSRREVNFANAGYRIPTFHDKDGNIHPRNEELQKEYIEHENSLFQMYDALEKAGVPKEDARFLLPYSFNANIIMGVDAHTLKNMIIKYTKTHLSKVPEIKEFGEKLYEIAKENIPYIIPEIDAAPYKETDPVLDFLESIAPHEGYEVLDKPVLLNCSQDIDNTILIAGLMRRYQYDYEQAREQLDLLEQEYLEQTGKTDFKEEFMRKIIFEGDGEELHQVNFQFQIPLSFAVLTHLTRHRTHHPLIPEFAPNVDLDQYRTPATIKNGHLDEYESMIAKNKALYLKFRDEYGVPETDLTAFTLSGNIVNVVTNMDAWTLAHILGLRECTKAQWETRDMAVGMYEEIDKIPGAEILSKLMGPTCKTQCFCKEGKESCGLVEHYIQEREKQLAKVPKGE